MASYTVLFSVFYIEYAVKFYIIVNLQCSFKFINYTKAMS